MKQFNSCPSPSKGCYFCCDCTFTRTGLPLVATWLSILWLTRLAQGLCQGSAAHYLSPLWCSSVHLGGEPQGAKLYNEPVIDIAVQPVTLS